MTTPVYLGPDLKPDVPQGKCHVCQEQKPIRFCQRCQHWLCDSCSSDVLKRGLAALKAFLGGPEPGCCGPNT